MSQTATKAPAGQPPATTKTNSSLAKPEPVNTLRTLLEKSKGQLAMALPKHLTPDKMIRVAMTTCQRTPKLLECDPISVVAGVMQAAELGLLLTGPLGHAYLVPFWNGKAKRMEAQFQIGYRGMIHLANNSGKVDYLNAHTVGENDQFDYRYGTDQFLKHKPAVDPGKCVYVYACVKLKGGSSDFEVMSQVEIDKHKEKYSQNANSDYSPWTTAWDEMAKKTVLRRLCKRVPMSIDLTTAVVIDECEQAGVNNDRPDVDVGTAALTQHRLESLKERINGTADEPTGDDSHIDHVDTTTEKPSEEAQTLYNDLLGSIKECGDKKTLGDMITNAGADISKLRKASESLYEQLQKDILAHRQTLAK